MADSNWTFECGEGGKGVDHRSEINLCRKEEKLKQWLKWEN
jgi:hypothetical protein